MGLVAPTPFKPRCHAEPGGNDAYLVAVISGAIIDNQTVRNEQTSSITLRAFYSVWPGKRTGIASIFLPPQLPLSSMLSGLVFKCWMKFEIAASVGASSVRSLSEIDFVISAS